MLGSVALEPLPPWHLKSTTYILPFWVPNGPALPDVAMHPLEAASSFASPASGQPVGGFATAWVVRYHESPVGPYDEILIQPGYFDVDVEGEDGRRRKHRKCRITRIYVSQKETCHYGRKYWNLCKHLARFEFVDNPNGSMSVAVFPHDTVTPYVKGEPSSAAEPFFRATFATTRYLPSFPLSLSLARFIGLDLEMYNPPLPFGDGSQDELTGTDEWCAITPQISTPKASIGWFDMRQGVDGDSGADGENNFWPGWSRWKFGVKLENTTVKFGPGRRWNMRV